MRVRLRTAIMLVDGQTGEDVSFKPLLDQEISLVEAPNPRPTANLSWWYVEGTPIGATEQGWRMKIERVVTTPQQVKDANDDEDSYLFIA